jgi:hypothetical protein
MPMNHNREEFRAERRRPTLGRTVGWCLGLALLFGWAAVFAIPLALRFGVAEAAAQRIPIAAAFAGVVLGIAVNVAPTARKLVEAFLGVIALGAIGWICGVLLGGLLSAADATRGIADALPLAGFVLGMVIGLLPLYAVIADIFRRKP